MAINRIKYVNVGSQMEESDFVRFGGGAILETLYVTENGTYIAPQTITGWNRVDVNVQDNLSIKFEIDGQGILRKKPIVMNFAGVEDIGDSALCYAYAYQEGVSGVIGFPDLLEISGGSACTEAFSSTNATSVLMPKLEEISGNCSGMFSGAKVAGCNLGALKRISGSCSNMFYECPLGNIALPNIEEIYGQNVAAGMFRNTNITWPTMPKLTTIYGNGACTNMFRGCLYLNGAIFDSLNSITGTQACLYMFADCNSEQQKFFSFPALRSIPQNNAFQNMLKDSVNVTLAFPKNMQSRIESLTGYSSTAPFGAVSGAVVFYLPSTYLLKGNNSENTYERNPIADYNAENSAWRLVGTKPDDTSFWIRDGIQTDPTVGTPIYSDRECTIQVDTVTSIE